MSFDLTILLHRNTQTENSPRTSCWEKEKASARKQLVSWREIHTAVRAFQITLQDKTEVQTRTCHLGWCWSHILTWTDKLRCAYWSTLLPLVSLQDREDRLGCVCARTHVHTTQVGNCIFVSLPNVTLNKSFASHF